MRVLSLSAVILLIAVAMSGCASKNRGISASSGISSGLCCAGNSFETFHVQAKTLPAFLGPIIVSNFSVALAERGFHPMSEGADVEVTVRFEQENLNRPRDHDDFDERIDGGGAMQFVAKIVVEMRETATGQMFWSGSIQRIHNVRPGDYMHTGRASIALLDAFRELLQEFPTE